MGYIGLWPPVVTCQPSNIPLPLKGSKPHAAYRPRNQYGGAAAALQCFACHFLTNCQRFESCQRFASSLQFPSNNHYYHCRWYQTLGCIQLQWFVWSSGHDSSSPNFNCLNPETTFLALWSPLPQSFQVHMPPSLLQASCAFVGNACLHTRDFACWGHHCSCPPGCNLGQCDV
jgi:hypothetical protein